MSLIQQVKKRSFDESGAMVAREAGLHAAYAAAGLLISRGAVFGAMSPFGASVAAAVPFRYMPSAILGCAVGYLLLSPINAFRYIAVVVSIGALRWVFNEIRRISQHRFFPAAAAFVPMFATGAALTFSASSELTELTACFLEALASAAGAYFIGVTVRLSYSKRLISGFSAREIAALSMTGCVLLLSFGSLKIGAVSVGRILAVLAILSAARAGSVGGGSIAGIAAGISFSLADTRTLFLSAAYGLSGLVGGLLSNAPKLAVAGATVALNTVISLTSEDMELVFAVLIESLIASVIFVFLPKEAGNFLSSVFTDREGQKSEEAVRRSVTARLSHCSKALCGVSSCVNAVSERLSRLYSANANWIYERAAEQTCSGCGLRVYCHEKQQELTHDDFHRLTVFLRENGFVTERNIEDVFLKRCCKAHELSESINTSFREYRSMEAAQRRITQIRSVVAGQFSGLSEILEDLSEELENIESIDSASSTRVREALSALGLTVIECTCRKSLGRGLAVEIELALTKKTAVSKSMLTREVSKACGRYFESPSLSYAADRIRVTLCERPLYDVEIGSAQHIYKGGELCGDCMNYFNNGEGSTVAILSDGMGTGGRAAVDSNMAVSIMTKLCKAGLSYDCSLAVVNSSLMIKSEDESMATLDVLDLNLYSGKAELMKAGAVTTFVRKNAKVLRKDMPSLPVGILNETRFMKESVTLSEGDFIVMVSDGVLTGDDEWIERMILSFREGSARDLSAHIVDEAARRRMNAHDDDITAMAFRIVENV